MEYTHSWRIPATTIDTWKNAFPQIVADVQRIVDEAGVKLSYDGGEGDDLNKPPMISVENGISLNGQGYGRGTFIMITNATRIAFCKTAHRPYDVVGRRIMLESD